MFTILFFVFIGHVFGDRQRLEIDKDDLKAREDARVTLSSYVEGIVNLDLQSKYVRSGNSSEIETDQKSSSFVISKSLATHEVNKSGQKVSLETREADSRSLVKHFDPLRSISATNDSMKFRRRFSVTSAVGSYTGKEKTTKTIRSKRNVRKKRDQLDSFNMTLEPVLGALHTKPYPQRTDVPEEIQTNINNTKLVERKEEQMEQLETSSEQESELSIRIQPNSTKIFTASYSAMTYLLNKLPNVLKSKILVTDEAEKVVLEDYVNSQSASTKALDAYNLAKKDERELLKRLLPDMPIILPTYRALRKGVAWNYTRYKNRVGRFFQRTSNELKQYESLKKDELASLDVFLNSSGQGDALESHHDDKSVEDKTIQRTDGLNAEETEIRDIEERAKVKEAERKVLHDVEIAEERGRQNPKEKHLAKGTEERRFEENSKYSTLAEMQLTQKHPKADNSVKQKSKLNPKAKVNTKENVQMTEIPVEDVEEQSPKIKRTIEIGKNQYAEEIARPEVAELQKLQGTEVVSAEKAKDPNDEKIAKAENIEQKNLEAFRPAAAEEAEKQRLQVTKIVSADKPKHQIDEKNFYAQTMPTEVKNLEAVELAAAKDAEIQELQEAKGASAEEAKQQKNEKKEKGEETERERLEAIEISAAEDTANQNATEKATAVEVELQKLKSDKASAVKQLHQIQKSLDKATAQERMAKLLETANEKTSDEGTVKAGDLKGQRPSFCGRLKVELSDAEKREILKAHNDARRREDATNMLQMVWDNEIAIIAQYKANTCEYFHSMTTDCSQRSLSQNLFTNFVRSKEEEEEEVYPPINYTKVTVQWTDEREGWDWNTLSCQEGKICTRWMAVTGAKAWRLGCGKSQCPTLNVRGNWHKMANFVVCNYGPFSMEFERGNRCSNCGNSTAELDEKGFTCETELCAQCDPRKKVDCKCGPAYKCHNGGVYSPAICGCPCPREFYGTYCERPCDCVDLSPLLCKKWATRCNDQSQKYWLPETCQNTCNTCRDYPRPASCNSEEQLSSYLAT